MTYRRCASNFVKPHIVLLKQGVLCDKLCDDCADKSTTFYTLQHSHCYYNLAEQIENIQTIAQWTFFFEKRFNDQYLCDSKYVLKYPCRLHNMFQGPQISIFSPNPVFNLCFMCLKYTYKPNILIRGGF